MEAVHKKDDAKTAFAEYDYSNFYYGAGDDPLNLLRPFKEWYDEALPNGYYLYSEPLSSAPDTRVRVKNKKTGEVHDLLNLASYNYLGISYRDEVKDATIEAVKKYGLGASGSPILSGTFQIHEELVVDAGDASDHCQFRRLGPVRFRGDHSGQLRHVAVDRHPDRVALQRRVGLDALLDAIVNLSCRLR